MWSVTSPVSHLACVCERGTYLETLGKMGPPFFSQSAHTTHACVSPGLCFTWAREFPGVVRTGEVTDHI